jgi:hypothetical protein
MSKIQTIICLFIFVVIICSMNVFFGITESFGGGGGGGGGRGGGGLGGGLGGGGGLRGGGGRGLGIGIRGVDRDIDTNIGGNQNTNGGYFFIPNLRILQTDN